MSVTISQIAVGRRLKVTVASWVGFGAAKKGLHDAGYKGVTPGTVLVSGQCEVPEGAGLIVTAKTEYTVDGWLVWRDNNGVTAAFADGLTPKMFDSVRGAMRLPGEPKPGSDTPQTEATPEVKPEESIPDLTFKLTAEQRQQLGKSCPSCSKGTLVAGQSRYGSFVGCDAYPKCAFIWKASKVEAQQAEPQPKQAESGDAAALAELITRLGSKGMDEAQVRAIVADEVAKLPMPEPGKMSYHVKVNEAEAKELASRPHFQMAEVLKRALMRTKKGMRFAQLLVGEAGTGKSTLCEHVAESLGLSYVYIPCSGGMSETKLVGRLTPNLNSGTDHWQHTPFTLAYANGGVVLVDEIDAADPNVLLVLNGLMEATFWVAPDGTMLQRHADFVLLAAANTYGTGADRMYVGRNQLDAAFLDRWLVITVDYDADLERSLITTPGLADLWHAARRKMRELKLRRVLSTRSMLRADALAQQCSMARADAVVAATEGWSDDERRKVGLAA